MDETTITDKSEWLGMMIFADKCPLAAGYVLWKSAETFEGKPIWMSIVYLGVN